MQIEIDSLFWERATEPEAIGPAYSDTALRALQEYFGDFPITISSEHLPVLKAMFTCANGARPLGELIDLVKQNKSIRVWWQKRLWPTSPIRPRTPEATNA